MTGVPAGETWFRRLALALGGALIVLAIWTVSQEGVAEGLRTDWTAFDNAASRLLDGEQIYRPLDRETESLPYLYPPYALWLAVPLGLVGFLGSYVLAAGSALLAFLGGIWLLRRTALRGEPSQDRSVSITTGLIAACTTGTAFSTVLIGQYSGLYVLALGLGLWLFINDRPALAGLALAILILKPNIAIALVVVLLWSRSWRALAGFGAGTVGALASSIPFGLSGWSGFWANVQQIADLQAMGVVPVSKMITFTSTVSELTGTAETSPLAIGSWLVFTTVVGVATLVVWTPKRFAESPQRAFAIWAIFVIIANPRMFFYDGTLVIFGVLALWSLPSGMLGERGKRLLPAIAFGLWFASWGAAFSALNVLVAPLGGLLITIVAFETWSEGRNSSGVDATVVSVMDTSADVDVDQAAPPAAA